MRPTITSAPRPAPSLASSSGSHVSKPRPSSARTAATRTSPARSPAWTRLADGTCGRRADGGRPLINSSSGPPSSSSRAIVVAQLRDRHGASTNSGNAISAQLDTATWPGAAYQFDPVGPRHLNSKPSGTHGAARIVRRVIPLSAASTSSGFAHGLVRPTSANVGISRFDGLPTGEGRSSPSQAGQMTSHGVPAIPPPQKNAKSAPSDASIAGEQTSPDPRHQPRLTSRSAGQARSPLAIRSRRDGNVPTVLVPEIASATAARRGLVNLDGHARPDGPSTTTTAGSCRAGPGSMRTRRRVGGSASRRSRRPRTSG